MYTDGHGDDQITVPKMREIGIEHLALGRSIMAAILQTKPVSMNENYCIYFIHLFTNFNEMYSHWSNQQLSSIGSDNGSAPNRRQVIIRTYDDIVYQYMRHSADIN